MLKMAVIERHHATGAMGLGFIQGLGSTQGAMAGTVAHDHHNLVVIGADDASMRMAAQAVADLGGGLVVVDGGDSQGVAAVAGRRADERPPDRRSARDAMTRSWLPPPRWVALARSLYGDELYGARGDPEAEADRSGVSGCRAVRWSIYLSIVT